jgi:HK97 family phage portal protein
MHIPFLGLTIERARPTSTQPAAPVATWGGYGSGRGWWPILVRDHYPGAWQRNDEIRLQDVLSFPTVFACVTLIASDIGKLRVKLMEQDNFGIWSEIESPAFSPVLRKPNHFQTRVKFFEQWIVSKLTHGNTYVLKERDQRGVVVALTILDPQRVKPLVAPNGDVYYELGEDWLAGLDEQRVAAPASEIIHDLMVPLYHPLVGVTPVYACGLAALQGLKIQNSSLNFFANGATPGGILIAPGAISDTTAQTLKEKWEANYSGQNAGKVAVLGDGLKYEPMSVNAVDSELIDQLKWSAETVCSCFHIPPYMVGVGEAPTLNNIEALNQQYYSQCLQSLIENLEVCLDEGLGLDKQKDGRRYGTEFDLQGLLRMDTAAKVKAAADAIKAGFLSPNEARWQFDLKPVEGGETPYLQQQNYSLAALNKRDQKADPFASSNPAPKPDEPDEPDEPPDDDDELEPDTAKTFVAIVRQRVAEGWMRDGTAA